MGLYKTQFPHLKLPLPSTTSNFILSFPRLSTVCSFLLTSVDLFIASPKRSRWLRLSRDLPEVQKTTSARQPRLSNFSHTDASEASDSTPRLSSRSSNITFIDLRFVQLPQKHLHWILSAQEQCLCPLLQLLPSVCSNDAKTLSLIQAMNQPLPSQHQRSNLTRRCLPQPIVGDDRFACKSHLLGWVPEVSFVKLFVMRS